MGRVVHLHSYKYMSLGLDKKHKALSESDELIAKVLRISEVSRIARIETNLREFVEAKWEARLNQAVKKATAMARQLKKPDQIAIAVNKIMSLWAGDVSDHMRKEVARMYQLARIAGWKKATKQTTASLTYDAPNATELDTGKPVGADTQRAAAGTLGEKVAKIKIQPLPSFDLIDEDAVRAMGDNQVFWIGKHYDKNVAGSIKDTTRKSMLEAGSNRVTAGKLMSQKVRDTLGHVRTPLGFVGSSKQYFEGLVANAATVARVHGQIRSFMDIGITRYKISNPGGRRTCAVCQHIAGKTFSIQQGATQLQTDLQAKKPDDIRASHPWMTPKQIRQISSNPGPQKGAAGVKDSKALADAGQALPPYHFRCRCTVDIDPAIGSFDKLVPMVPPTTKTPFAMAPVAPKIPSAAKLSAAELIEQRLAAGEFVSSKPLTKGVNKAATAILMTPDGKMTTAVMKFAQDEKTFRSHIKIGTFHRREAALYQIDKAMGGKTVVPPTISKDMGKGSKGFASLQHFVKDAKDNMKVSGVAIQPRTRRVMLLDAISANDDRHAENIMFRKLKKGLDPVAIDNGLTFPSGTPNRFLFVDRGDPADLLNLDAATHKMVKRLKLPKVIAILKEAEVPDKAIYATVVRVRALQLDAGIIAKQRPAKRGARASDAVLNFTRKSFRKPGELLPGKEIKKIGKLMKEFSAPKP